MINKATQIELLPEFYPQVFPDHTITSKKFKDNEERVLNADTFVVFDLETVGLSPVQSTGIIEIGAVKLDHKGNIIDRFSRYVDPYIQIPKKITTITGIVQDDVYKQGRCSKVLKEFIEWFGDATMVAHNSDFDWNRFVLPLAHYIGEYPTNPVVDTLTLSRELYPIGSHKLGNVCDYLGIDLTMAHRAIHDAEATAQVFQNMLSQIRDAHPNYKEKAIKYTSREINYPKQTILAVNQWKRAAKESERYPHDFNRIYVDLNYGKVFWDVIEGAWEICESRVPINFNDIQNQLYELTHKSM